MRLINYKVAKSFVTCKGKSMAEIVKFIYVMIFFLFIFLLSMNVDAGDRRTQDFVFALKCTTEIQCQFMHCRFPFPMAKCLISKCRCCKRIANDYVCTD
ncbi:unnamed protein product [Trifolium pratense]|uniref:Uncharacterized protein n=1 Tax=Trifolium pratense TaxID=57577 RepID=A0ACB0J525_TRIPR|nr:unnamed protein product [Trifolium pratense]